jgi:hypothetical protein
MLIAVDNENVLLTMHWHSRRAAQQNGKSHCYPIDFASHVSGPPVRHTEFVCHR